MNQDIQKHYRAPNERVCIAEAPACEIESVGAACVLAKKNKCGEKLVRGK